MSRRTDRTNSSLTLTSLSTAGTPSPPTHHHRRTTTTTSMEDSDGATPTSPATTQPPSSMPVREDCWSNDATYTLVEAWGDRYLDLNRGNLRQKHWQDVADAVNAVHGHVKKARRTDVQCKNRIDTLKKRYKIEKARVSDSNSGGYTSQWPFFSRLDSLIGSSYKPSPAAATHRKTPPALPPSPSLVPVGPRSKRPAAIMPPAVVDDSFFRRNFSAIAAAAAAAAEAESEKSRSRSSGGGTRRRDGDRNGTEGYRQLAEAIERLGEIYERVEESKQRQMIKLEKQRMQFAKDLEIQRMKLFMDSQIQIEKMKRARRTSEADFEEVPSVDSELNIILFALGLVHDHNASYNASLAFRSHNVLCPFLNFTIQLFIDDNHVGEHISSDADLLGRYRWT
ncbi:unnamed protein product [Camellia sinensis]